MSFQLFHITNKAFIFHKNKFLLMKSNDPLFFGALECPGGRTNLNESVLNALYREIKEEIGIDINKKNYKVNFFCFNQISAEEYGFDKEIQVLETYYKIVIPNKFKLKISNLEESSEFVWINKNTDLDSFLYRFESRKKIYKKAQLQLIT